LADTVYDVCLVVGFDQVFEMFKKGVEDIVTAGIQIGNLAEAEAVIVCMAGPATKVADQSMLNSALKTIVTQQWPSVQANRSICGLIKSLAPHLQQE
jgi:hypothetical protein